MVQPEASATQPSTAPDQMPPRSIRVWPWRLAAGAGALVAGVTATLLLRIAWSQVAGWNDVTFANLPRPPLWDAIVAALWPMPGLYFAPAAAP